MSDNTKSIEFEKNRNPNPIYVIIVCGTSLKCVKSGNDRRCKITNEPPIVLSLQQDKSTACTVASEDANFVVTSDQRRTPSFLRCTEDPACGM